MVLFAKACFLLTCLLQFIWAFRLWRLGLTQRYRGLFIYLIATGLFSLGAIVLREYAVGKSPLAVMYIYYWVVTTPVGWMLLFVLVLEAGTRMLDGYAGLERLGQIVIYVLMGLTGVLFVCMTVLDVSLATWNQYWAAQENAVYAALTGVCFLLFAMAKGFRLQVNRNVKIIFGSLGVLFALNAGFILLGNLGAKLDPAVIRPLMGVVTVVFTGAGTILFSRLGEDSRTIPTLDANPARAGAALRDVNAVLLQVLHSKQPIPSSAKNRLA